MNKIKVSREVSDALDKMSNNEWSKQFNLISHCKSFSGNGILMHNSFQKEFKVLNTLQPLEFAKCLILGYEIKEEVVTQQS